MSKRFIGEFSVYVQGRIHANTKYTKEKKLAFVNFAEDLVRAEKSGYIPVNEAMRSLVNILDDATMQEEDRNE